MVQREKGLCAGWCSWRDLLKWPATSPVTRSLVAHLPMHGNPTAPPSFLPASAIHFFHMGLTRLCEQEVLQDPQLNHAAWLAAFAALTGTDLTTEHLALLQHPSIPGQFPSKVFAPYKRAIRSRLRNTSLRSSPALAPLGQSRNTVHAALAPKLLRMTRQSKNFRELPGILSLPG